MSDPPIRTLRCPGCDGEPLRLFSHQFFCANDRCRMLVWDPADDPLTIMGKAQVIDVDAWKDGAE